MSDGKVLQEEIYAADIFPVRDKEKCSKIINNIAQEIQPRPISSDVTTSGSSRSLKINENQRQKLNSFAEKLRTGE